VEIKTRKLFKELVKKLTLELLDEESLEEITTTAASPGYMTPYAFRGKKKKKKKVDEALEDKDLKIITKLIRSVVANVLRDIWLKRASWK
jgi:hypothetical protein